MVYYPLAEGPGVAREKIMKKYGEKKDIFSL